MIRCRVLGHRFRFAADDRRLTWRCDRRCGAGGAKQYPTTDAALRYAAAFDRRDSDALGRRAPLVGLLPLRLGRRLLGR